MERAQWIEAVGALLVLGSLTYGAFHQVGTARQLADREQATVVAVGLARGVLELCALRAFDERSLSRWCSHPAELTPPGALGPEVGEGEFVEFDDLDDFHGWSRVDTVGGVPYQLEVRVYYADPNDLDRPASGATFFKTVQVLVHSPGLAEPVRLKRTYAYFR
jgi:hypothetical protein|nr:MAG: hypothetical protein KatS3mg041_1770 [Bacteroidota bacterium]